MKKINTEIDVLQEQLNHELFSICDDDVEYNLENDTVEFSPQADAPRGSTIDKLQSFLEAKDYKVGSAMNGAMRVVAIEFIYD